jgi:hypothetical protein
VDEFEEEWKREYGDGEEAEPVVEEEPVDDDWAGEDWIEGF